MKQVETTREAMINRRSVRKYKTDMIPRDIIERIVEAGTYAANGRGHQASIILAVTNKELRDKLSEMNRKIGGWDEGFDPFYGAPVVLVVLAEKDWPTHVYDGSLVMGNLMLAAHTEGIEEGKQILSDLGVTGEYEGIGHCVLGYPDEETAEAKPRKDDYVFWVE